jgi:hypothetical protein
MRWILVHLPHLLPPFLAFGFLARLGVWAADQPPQQLSDDEAAEWRRLRADRQADRRRPVLGRAARAGVLSLTPLVAAVLTGLFIYTFNLRNDRPSAALVWSHVAVSVLGLAIVSWKVAVIGARRIRASVSVRRPHEAIASLVMLALGVPLLASGGWLLAAPSGSSFADYFHLVTSVWWTLLLQWHLWRYLGRALGRTFGHSRPAASQPAGR